MFRQAESQKNAFSIVNSAVRVLFRPGTDTIVDLSILYGGIGSTTINARKSCKKLIGRQWNDQMLNEACRLALEEIFLPASALGGKVEYRRTLLVSFLFRFYLEVLHGLHQMDVDLSPQDKSPQDPTETLLDSLQKILWAIPSCTSLVLSMPVVKQFTWMTFVQLMENFHCLWSPVKPMQRLRKNYKHIN